MTRRKRNRQPRQKKARPEQQQTKSDANPLFSPSSAPTEERIKEKQPPVGKQPANSNHWYENPGAPKFIIWDVRIAAAIAVFTALQFGVSFFQLSAMKDQNVEIKNQSSQIEKTLELMRMEQRAWLSVKGVRVKTYDKATYFADLTIENTGDTPGTIVSCEGHPNIGLDWKKAKQFLLADNPEMKILVPPKGTATIMLISSTPPLAKLDSIGLPRDETLVDGEFTYTAGATLNGRTRFRFRYNGTNYVADDWGNEME